jgi:CheY-like chemotaxis protein
MRTLLLVEDSEDDIFFLRRALKEADPDLDLQVVMDGQQAIDYLRGSGKFMDRRSYPLPFLILLDLKLPHVMGLKVLQWIRAQERFKYTAVVILTSSQLETDIKETERLGCTFYMVKPAAQKQLLDLLRRLTDTDPFRAQAS